MVLACTRTASSHICYSTAENALQEGLHHIFCSTPCAKKQIPCAPSACRERDWQRALPCATDVKAISAFFAGVRFALQTAEENGIKVTYKFGMPKLARPSLERVRLGSQRTDKSNVYGLFPMP